MTSRAETGRRSSLADTAIDWVVRVEARDVSVGELNAFGEWLASDPQHQQAYEEADKLWRALGRSLDRSDFEEFRATKQSRKHANAMAARTPSWRGAWPAAAAASMAIVLLAAILVLPDRETAAPAEPVLLSFEAGGSATKHFTLRDGSRLTLGAGSSLTAELSVHSRSITLSSGEAFFEVTPDASRPFVVAAGTAKVRVTGTAFDVQLKGPLTLIAVAEGQVRVSNSKLFSPQETNTDSASTPVALDQTVILKAGERVRAFKDEGLDTIVAIRPENIGAWRKNRLIYESVPLAAIVADLNRYDSRQIAIAGDDVANIKISATFDNSDIDSVLTSLTELLPLEVHQASENQVVIRRRPPTD